LFEGSLVQKLRATSLSFNTTINEFLTPGYHQQKVTFYVDQISSKANNRDSVSKRQHVHWLINSREYRVTIQRER
jgi:hypothetical protein